MVSYLRSIVFGIVSGKRLIYRDFLEERDREYLEQCVERGVEGEALLDDCDEDVDRDGDPDLGLHCILAGTEEGLDPQMLLDPLEQLNDILPINNGFLKSRSITPSIPCVHRAYQ